MKKIFKRILGYLMAIVIIPTTCVVSGPATPVYAETLNGVDASEYEKAIEEYFYEHYKEYSQYECYIDVHATAISEMELAYNRSAEYNNRENIYWGYKLSDQEVQALKSGNNYYFVTDDNGNVKPIKFEEYDDTYDKMIKDVEIGTGIIVITATIGVVSGAAGLPAVSMVFIAAATSSAEFAVTSGAIGGLITYATEMISTADNDSAIKAALANAAKEYKVGAILGVLFGGAAEIALLKTATASGLTMNEAAIILKETKLPVEVVKYFRNTEEASVYTKEAGLVCKEVGGKAALVRDIDLTYKAETNGKIMTNLERMKEGKAALDPATGQAYELHHVGQQVDSPLAILTAKEHDISCLHNPNIEEGVHKILTTTEWNKQRAEFWINMAKLYEGGAI